MKYNFKIILIGAGSQGCVTMDILKDSGTEILGFIDDNILAGEYVNGKKVIGKIADVKELSRDNCKFVICIGNNYARKAVSEILELDNSSYYNAIHSSSVILPSASIGHGNMIFANSFIGARAKIGNHVIINNGVIVEHDCVINDFASISPGCCMGGKCLINEEAFISVGVTLGPRVNIGKNSIIGAGAVVTGDIPPGVLAYGVPAKVIRKILPDEMWDHLL